MPERQGPRASTRQSSIHPVSQLLPTSSGHWEPHRWFQNLSMLVCEMEPTAGSCCGGSCCGPIDQVKSGYESVGGALSSIGSRALSPTLFQLFAPVTLALGNSPLQTALPVAIPAQALAPPTCRLRSKALLYLLYCT